jgi:hypothetical protein
MNVINKLECLSLASLSSLILCLLVRLEPIRVRYLSDPPLFGRLLALPANIRLGWKGLPGTNTPAQYGRKKFYNIGPRGLYHKTYYTLN